MNISYDDANLLGSGMIEFKEYLLSTLATLQAARQLIGYADSIKAPEVIADLEQQIRVTKNMIEKAS